MMEEMKQRQEQKASGGGGGGAGPPGQGGRRQGGRQVSMASPVTLHSWGAFRCLGVDPIERKNITNPPGVKGHGS